MTLPATLALALPLWARSPVLPLGVVAWVACCLVALPLAALGLYWLLSLPLRRQERARFFLHLLETSLQDGGTPEKCVLAVSETREKDVGASFHLLAAYIRSGYKLGGALERVPQMLPPAAAAMLRVGEALGDIRKVLPACKGLLRDSGSTVRAASSYAIILAIGILPILPAVAIQLRIMVMPKFKEIVAGDLGKSSFAGHWLFKWVDVSCWVSFIPFGIALVLALFAFGYIAGPRGLRWIEAAVFPVSDWVACLLPWRRLRMKRDFAKMLGLLLDAGVPEARAAQLAAEATGNRFFAARARRMQADLSGGAKLGEALRRLDNGGEFQWRLENAARSQTGFNAALAGWIEALDSKAFQQEQTAAHILTTSMVLINGIIVGVVMVGFFGILTGMINNALLW